MADLPAGVGTGGATAFGLGTKSVGTEGRAVPVADTNARLMRAVLRTIKVLGQSQGLRYRIVRDALSAVDAANPSDTRRFA